MKRPQKPPSPQTAADPPPTEEAPGELVLYLQYAVPDVAKISPIAAHLLQMAICEITGEGKAGENTASRH
ncbi:MAG TPA: hypothetical protein VF601_22755 [Beijerinckiaceae bacterium]|jgi:hypothetical protein